MKNLEDILNLVTGNLDPERKIEVLSGLREEAADEAFFSKAKITWALMSSTQKMSDYRIEGSYAKLQSRMRSENKGRTVALGIIKYAAVLVVMIGISGLLFYLFRQNPTDQQPIQYTSVIAEKGQISKVILPDSSVVWLNSKTSLRYDSRFSQTNRNLTLSGQAFLDVKKNKDLPLIVSCGTLQVKVLGTRFDVCAYPDENNVRVILESGKIELSDTRNTKFKYYLNPGEMADFSSQSGNLSIVDFPEDSYLAWKDGELIFKDTPMTDVIRRLERKYDIEVVVKNQEVYRSVFNAKFKNESLKEILDYIRFSCHINYRLVPGKENERIKILFN